MPTMTILRGLPASGKSSFAKAIAAASNGKVVRLNRDDFREGLFGTTGERGVLSSDQERRISEIEQYVAREAIVFGSDVIIDALNLRAEYVKHWISLGEEMGAQVRFDDSFLEVPIETLIERDAARQRSVGADVIRDLARRFNIDPAKLRYPKRPEIKAKVDIKFPLYDGTPDAPKAVIVDIDGTVALMLGLRGPFEWHRVGMDAPNVQVVELVRQLANSGHQIVFVSGRDAVCRAETIEWLDFHFDLSIRNSDGEIVLFMRPADDERDDTVVKNEIFERDIHDRFDVTLVLDDRNKVVKMWRAKGLTCLQVAEGNF
jgi:predicted kinase